MNIKKFRVLMVIMGAFFVGLVINQVSMQAATRTQGVDWAKFQGNTGKFGYDSDTFVFSQAGGFYGGSNIPQATYNSQVQSALKAGKHVHTYLWDGVGGNMTNAKAMMNYYLPRVKTPKGSIVALDYEDGASNSVTANTDVILAQMRMIASKGYTPVLYSGAYYLQQHVDYKRILKEFPNSFWVASYASCNVAKSPDFNYFIPMPGVAIWQFTSMYRITGYINGVPQGLDGNIDLTGITGNGYTNKPAQTTVSKPKTPKVTTKESYTQQGAFKPNRTLTVYTSLTGKTAVAHYYKGESVIYDKVIIRSDKFVWAQYKSVSGANHFIQMGKLGGASYGSRTVATQHSYYTVKSGDSFWAIANSHGTTVAKLCALNGLKSTSTIHPGQSLIVK